MTKQSETFAERLREACERNRGPHSGYGNGAWLRRELKNRKIEVSAQGVSNWLKGKTSPREDALNALALILDVAPSWLAGFDAGPTAIMQDQSIQAATDYSLPISLGNGRLVEISHIPVDLTEAQAEKLCKVIMALAA